MPWPQTLLQALLPPEPPPSPPSDHGDRVDQGADEAAKVEVESPNPVKKKRVMSEKQLENLRKGREVRAAKAAVKKGKENAPTPPPPEVESRWEPVEEAEEEEPPPKPKRKLSPKQLEALRKARETKASPSTTEKEVPADDERQAGDHHGVRRSPGVLKGMLQQVFLDSRYADFTYDSGEAIHWLADPLSKPRRLFLQSPRAFGLDPAHVLQRLPR